MAYVQAVQLGRGPSTLDKIATASKIAENVINGISGVQNVIEKPGQIENENALKRAQITASGSESDLRDLQGENIQREQDYAAKHGGLTPTEAASLANSPAEQARVAHTGQLIAAQQAMDSYNKNTTDPNTGKFVNPNGAWNGIKSWFGLGNDKSEAAKGNQMAYERALHPQATDKEIELGMKSDFPTASGSTSDSSFAAQRGAGLKALALQAGQGNRKDLLSLISGSQEKKTAPSAPPVGTIVQGHQFLGGDPNDSKSWKQTEVAR